MLSTVMQTFNQINLASNKPHRYEFPTMNFIKDESESKYKVLRNITGFYYIL